jgi:hypothetical protein
MAIKWLYFLYGKLAAVSRIYYKERSVLSELIQKSGKGVEFAVSATRSRNAVRMACVTGPGTPSPTGRPSISTTGVSSPMVPVVKT